MTHRKNYWLLAALCTAGLISGCAGVDVSALLADLGLNSLQDDLSGSSSDLRDDGGSSGDDMSDESIDDTGSFTGDSDSDSLEDGDSDSDGSGGLDDDGSDDNGGSTDLIGDADAGALVFTANNCNACHGADGTGPPSLIGRSFSSLAEHARNGKEHPGGAFPSLTDQDLADLEAFLAP